jgi:hypothetical protein
MTASNPITPGVRKDLQPFGGINGQAAWQKAKDEALRTKGRQYCFDHGFITAKDLDDEELVAGRCRDQTGRIPKTEGKTELIPRHLYDEMVAEHEMRYKQKLRENLDRMIDVMVEIADDDTVEPRDRLEAAKYIFERTAGKTPQTVSVTVKTAPWEDLLSQVSGIAQMSRADHERLQTGIVEAEVVEIDEEGNPIGQEAQDQEEEPYGQERGTGFAPYGTDPADDAAPMPAAERPDKPAGPMNDEYWTEGDIHRRDPPREPYQDEPELNYGRRADEKRSYAQQAQDAQALAKRRKEARQRIQGAIKKRKIARAVGADAIKDEITGVELGDDGKLRFEQT